MDGVVLTEANLNLLLEGLDKEILTETEVRMKATGTDPWGWAASCAGRIYFKMLVM